MFGRVHGNTIEIEETLNHLDGKRVRVTVEVVEDSFADRVRNAELDERPVDEEERAAIDEVRSGKAELVSHEAVGARLKRG